MSTATLNNALEIVNQLAEGDREKLFCKIREQRRKTWIKAMEAEAEQALKDHREGKLRALSSSDEIRAYVEEICNSEDE